MNVPSKVINQICSIVGKENVNSDEASLLVHAYDCSLSRTRPDLVVSINQVSQVAPIIKLLYDNKIPFVPRASATNHAGSCCALQGGVVLNLSPLKKIIQINTQERYAVVEPGVITAELQKELNKLGFFYAPDPASERICTLGGNLAQNASGARCLKYGGTVDHVLEAKVVLPTGEEIFLSRQDQGPDWIGLICGSEGTLGIVTQIKVKILPLSEHIRTCLVTFRSLEECVQTVTDLTAVGIIPRCVEAMDQVTIQAIEKFSNAGYPIDAKALLILELDGELANIKKDIEVLEQLCKKNNSQQFLIANNEEARFKLWVGRKSAYASMACLAPNVMVGDGTVPRSELPKALKKVREYLDEQKIYASLLFHAGDGNFHPHIIFDERNKLEVQKANQAIKKILQICIECGGTVSGEHGIGVEKRRAMAFQYTKDTLQLFCTIKKAIDSQDIANPLKLIPFNFNEKARSEECLDERINVIVERIKKRKDLKIPCVIVGNNTKLKTTKHNLISTVSLNKIIDIDLVNYTATVEAGVSLDELQQELNKRKVFCKLPSGKGSVGGTFASGCVFDFLSSVTGIEAILPDGSVVKYGGKVMKNAAGYNLARLMFGSKGNFGVITSITFKLYAKEIFVVEKDFDNQVAETILYTKIKHALDKDNLFNSSEGKR